MRSSKRADPPAVLPLHLPCCLQCVRMAGVGQPSIRCCLIAWSMSRAQMLQGEVIAGEEPVVGEPPDTPGVTVLRTHQPGNPLASEQTYWLLGVKSANDVQAVHSLIRAVSPQVSTGSRSKGALPVVAVLSITQPRAQTSRWIAADNSFLAADHL